MLEDVDTTDMKGAPGEGGTGEMKKNYFGHVVQQISKEIQELMNVMKNIVGLPRKHQFKEKDDQDSLWKL